MIAKKKKKKSLKIESSYTEYAATKKNYKNKNKEKLCML